MATWFLAPSLDKLFDEVNDAYPGRSKASDGSIGDAAHSSRESEHNPHTKDDTDVPVGAVTAIDITATDAKLRDHLLDKLIGASRVWYVINRGFIYSRTHNWEKRPYSGPNPHTNHIHVSLVQTKAAVNSKASWGIAAAAPAPKPDPKPETPKPTLKALPVLSYGDKDKTLVPFLKRFFWAKPPNQDEVFGTGTRTKVRNYQLKNGLVADGVVGPKTWAKIKSGGTALPSGYKAP